mgnify:CR=1 FL=1
MRVSMSTEALFAENPPDRLGYFGVLGMASRLQFAVYEVAIDGDFEHAALGGDEQNLKCLSEFLEQFFSHADRTARVVSSPAEFDGHVHEGAG